MRHMIVMMGIAGALIPITFFGFYYSLPGFSNWWYGLPWWTSVVRLLVWPSSLLMLGDPLDQSWILPAVSTALNAGLYVAIGFSLWYGYKESKIVLLGTIAVLLLGAYVLVNL